MFIVLHCIIYLHGFEQFFSLFMAFLVGLLRDGDSNNDNGHERILIYSCCWLVMLCRILTVN